MLSVFCGLWIGHILYRNCLQKHIIEGKVDGRIEATGTRGRKHMVLLDDLKEKGGYWKLKEDALDRSLWRSPFGRGCGRVVRLQIECMKFRLLDVTHIGGDYILTEVSRRRLSWILTWISAAKSVTTVFTRHIPYKQFVT